jgi:gluconate 5-dehydrogenase
MNQSDRKSTFDLTGSRAFITGSSQGIGFALARGLAEAEAAIVLNGRNRGKLERAAAELRKEGFTIAAAVFDATDRDAVVSSIGKIESEIGVIDILVNNVGIQHRAPLEDFPADAWERLINTNLSSVFHVSQAVAKHMIPRMAGKIINISSVQSQLSRSTIAPYAAAKGGVAIRFLHALHPTIFEQPTKRGCFSTPVYSSSDPFIGLSLLATKRALIRPLPGQPFPFRICSG